ncbi:MAG: penicillin-binding protein [Chromatiales bacterium]|nr:penicillin-binding protein [Chromatiales bacterium]
MLLALAIVLGLLIWREVDRSPLQARFLTGLAGEMQYSVQPGPSDAIRFPREGPFDQRLGYSALPEFSARLAGRGFEVAAQARIAPRMADVVDRGLFAPYREKTRAGLAVRDCAGEPLFIAAFPERFYPDFASVPGPLAASLLFIENRELLSNRHPTKNPAIEWDRFARATLDQFLSKLNPDHDAPGGSTLATQIEKYRHSPGGRTASGREKLRQMASASLRAYLGGEDTTAVRRQLVVDYLNTVPLAAWPGYGEVIGIGDGLWVWYGREFDEINRLLRDEAAPLPERALAYKQALSLLISQRRPTAYLTGNLARLDGITNTYLRLMAVAGLIPPALRDAAVALPLALRQSAIEPARSSFVSRKAANAARTHLAGLTGVRQLYELDRLDLAATSTLDERLQEAVAAFLREISTPAGAARAGLTGERLLAGANPSRVIYSFMLFERTAHANVVRVQTDNFDQPLDINEGTKLDLGSTAKLRTLVTYLEIVARLHGRLAPLTPDELRAVPVASRDRLGRWAVDYFLGAGEEDRSLARTLDAALERRYPASPAETFFTGGGQQTFANFDPADNGRVVSVREGLQRSVNLVFVRLMRDIVQHTISELPTSSATLLDDASDPKRMEYLERFADKEGRVFLQRFYRKYQGASPAGAEALLLRGIRPTPKRLATIYRSIEPAGSVEEFAAFLRGNLPNATVAEATIPRLYADYSAERYDLADRGYIAGVHPLELWLVGYLRARPDATLREVLDASRAERQTVYGWLFKTRRKGAQDSRIRSLVELEAFLEIHRSWRRLGYPFESLTPSYGTALGSSADRPAALAELMGILLNDGVRAPTLRIDTLQFATGTPYETRFAARPSAGERVLPAEVAAAVRGVLAQVVTTGTARRLDGVFTAADGSPLEVGGKTGTGDHRFETYGRGGQLISSRVVSRSGTFVFFIGERYFGTLTAYVKGPEAAGYQFTSALPTQILKGLAPTLRDAINREPREGTTCAADAPRRPSAAVPAAARPSPVPRAGGSRVEALDTAPLPASAEPDVPTPAP